MSKRHLVTQDVSLTTRNDENEPTIEGYFAVFGVEYWPVGRDKDWSWYETIAPTAFDLERDRDVRALVNHDSTLVLGRTTAGTLDLKVDGHGLYGRIKVNPADPDAMALYERVKRGDVSQCSFGFNILKEQWTTEAGSAEHCELQDVELWEVSCCTFPAYDETEISARTAEARAVLDSKAAKWREDMRARLAGRKEAQDA